MIVNISTGKEFILFWQKGQVDLYLAPKGNEQTAYNDLKDEDLRILKGLWNHLQSKKRTLAYSHVESAIEEVIRALDRVMEERA